MRADRPFRSEYYANFKCHYAYAFDTYHNKSVWDIVRVRIFLYL